MSSWLTCKRFLYIGDNHWLITSRIQIVYFIVSMEVFSYNQKNQVYRLDEYLYPWHVIDVHPRHYMEEHSVFCILGMPHHIDDSGRLWFYLHVSHQWCLALVYTDVGGAVDKLLELLQDQGEYVCRF
jgi:hypothetical protein